MRFAREGKQLTLTLLDDIFHEYLFSRHVTTAEENNTIYLKFSITNQLWIGDVI